MLDKVSQVISVIFHPLWMPLLIFFVIEQADPLLIYNPAIKYFIIIVLLINVVAPGLSIYMMKRRKVISSLQMEKRSERITPLILIVAYYTFTYFLFRYKHIPVSPEFYSMILGLLMSMFIALIITLKWKISIHMLAQGGMIGVIVALNQEHYLKNIVFLIVSAIVIAGVVGSARARLKAHSLSQIYSGFLLGFIVCFICIYTGIVL